MFGRDVRRQNKVPLFQRSLQNSAGPQEEEEEEWSGWGTTGSEIGKLIHRRRPTTGAVSSVCGQVRNTAVRPVRSETVQYVFNILNSVPLQLDDVDPGMCHFWC